MELLAVEVRRVINKDGLIYKLDAVVDYLKNNGGYEYKVYNHLCPDINTEPDSNIVEYAEDVKDIIKEILEEKDEKIT